MADIQKVIDGIMADPRLAHSRVFADRVYTDEPILRTGSQMKNYLPQQYKDMKALSRPVHDGFDYRRPSETKLFYLQARFMEDWEDDFPFTGTFNRYYPTYAMMNDQQLRGYFSWRTKVRKGDVRETSLSFAFVYLYELLNCIGGTAEECFDKLCFFWHAYRKFTPELNRYVVSWMRDFVVYHDLPSGLISQFIDTSLEQALVILRQAEREAGLCSFSSVQLFDALATLSVYRIDKSAFFKENPEDVRLVACNVFFDFCAHCAKRRKRGLVDSWFGAHSTSNHPMFQAAVFYEENPHADCLYRVNEVHAYSCRDGQWAGVRQYRSLARNGELGAVLATVDSLMRRAVSFNKPIKQHPLPKYLREIIEANVEAWAQSKREAEQKRVSIDRSKLAGIRSRSAEIREQLLIEEERTGIEVSEAVRSKVELSAQGAKPTIPAESLEHASEPPLIREPISSEVQAIANGGMGKAEATSVAAPSNAEFGPYGLSGVELSFLRALLCGSASAQTCLGSESEDVVVDSINEKLFDLLGDTALEYGEYGVRVIEDYENDVKEALGL